ncbi:MAG: hypothetical protein R3224_02795 [Balneolaceae bacterium]|nr:hypothetical protein [Balneolaceae bacterium]
MSQAANGYGYDEEHDEYLDLNLRLVYMVDDFYELMLIALLNAGQTQNGYSSSKESR